MTNRCCAVTEQVTLMLLMSDCKHLDSTHVYNNSLILGSQPISSRSAAPSHDVNAVSPKFTGS